MLPLAALLLASLIWGATSPVMKWTLQSISPFTLAFLRFTIASLILVPLFWKYKKIELSDLPKILLAVITGITVHIPLFFFGLKLTFAINAAFIIATIPIFTLAAAALFLKERLTLKLIFAATSALFGLVLISGPPILNAGLAHLFGALLLLGSSLSWVSFEVVSKKFFKKYSPFTLMFYLAPIGAVTLLPFAFLEFLINPADFSQFQIRGLVGILYGALFSSTVAYTLWQWGLSKLPVAEAGFFLYLEPISGILVSILLLGETITWVFAVGAVLIILGVVLAEHKRRQHPLHQQQ